MTHCFKSGGLNIVLDVYSGSVHLVDEPTYDIIGMYETTEKDEIRKRILEKYGKTGEATAEECMAAMNRVLPPALQVSRVRMVDDRFPKVSAALRQAEYTITLRGGGACAIASALPSFLAQEEIMALRKTKRSETMVNIRPMIHALTARTDEEKNTAVLTARVSFVEAATLKPDLLVESLCAFAGAQPERCEIRRTCLLGEKDGQSVPLIDL